MKAVVCTKYGPPEVLQLVDAERPTPGPREFLVKINASTVNSSDWYVRSGIKHSPLPMQIMFRVMVGFTRPRKPILGLILAGVVVEVGRDVTRFHVGDRVCAFTKFHFGAYAEFTCLEETSCVGASPTTVSDAEAAAIVYGGLLGLHFLRRGEVKAGQRVLIYGASGAVGMAMVQLAKNLGAEVTGVCGPQNVEFVRALGATTVLDYTTQAAPPEGARYDVVIDAVGKRKTSALRTACERALTPGGRLVSVDDGTPELLAADLIVLKDLVERGVLKPCIDRTYPLEELAAAHRYVEADHKRGNVVITVAH